MDNISKLNTLLLQIEQQIKQIKYAIRIADIRKAQCFKFDWIEYSDANGKAQNGTFVFDILDSDFETLKALKVNLANKTVKLLEKHRRVILKQLKNEFKKVK